MMLTGTPAPVPHSENFSSLVLHKILKYQSPEHFFGTSSEPNLQTSKVMERHFVHVFHFDRHLGSAAWVPESYGYTLTALGS